MNTFTHKTIKAQNKNGTALQFFVENFISKKTLRKTCWFHIINNIFRLSENKE